MFLSLVREDYLVIYKRQEEEKNYSGVKVVFEHITSE